MIKFHVCIKRLSQRGFIFPVQSMSVQDKDRNNILWMFSSLHWKTSKGSPSWDAVDRVSSAGGGGKGSPLQAYQYFTNPEQQQET
jgi:hypothetical protein